MLEYSYTTMIGLIIGGVILLKYFSNKGTQITNMLDALDQVY